jgi:hypothetical protein
MANRNTLTVALRAFRLLSVFGALTLLGSAATLLLHGGWQSAAAGFATVNGIGFALTFAVIAAAGERPRPLQPGWTRMADGPRRAAVEPAPPPPVEASARASGPARSAHRALPPERPRTA